jgi:hypothetical protein
MKCNDSTHDETWEHDAVWKLLDQAPPTAPSGHFVDDTVRAARLTRRTEPGSIRAWTLAAFCAGLCGIAAALMMSLSVNRGDSSPPSVAHGRQAEEIQEIAETETLIAAADHLDQFSDTELVTLIGF